MGIKENEALVREYYRTAELWLPSKPNWRYFRVMLFNGQVKKIPGRTTSIEKLRKWLVSLAPAHVYYSCSMFLNPSCVCRKMENRERKDVLYQNLFLGSDALYFDIDKKKLDDAKGELHKVIERLHTKYSHDNFQFIYSGSRGFHLKDFDFVCPKDSHPVKSEQLMGAAKKKMTLEISEPEDEGVEAVDIDAPVSYNTRGIIRLPKTIHGSTGNLVEIINESDIDDYKPKKILKLSKLPKSINLSEEIDRLTKLIGE